MLIPPSILDMQSLLQVEGGDKTHVQNFLHLVNLECSWNGFQSVLLNSLLQKHRDPSVCERKARAELPRRDSTGKSGAAINNHRR